MKYPLPKFLLKNSNWNNDGKCTKCDTKFIINKFNNDEQYICKKCCRCVDCNKTLEHEFLFDENLEKQICLSCKLECTRCGEQNCYRESYNKELKTNFCLRCSKSLLMYDIDDMNKAYKLEKSLIEEISTIKEKYSNLSKKEQLKYCSDNYINHLAKFFDIKVDNLSRNFLITKITNHEKFN